MLAHHAATPDHLEQIDTFARMGSVAHYIPEAHQGVHPSLGDVLQDRLEGMQVAVDVGNECDLHRSEDLPRVVKGEPLTPVASWCRGESLFALRVPSPVSDDGTQERIIASEDLISEADQALVGGEPGAQTQEVGEEIA